MFNLKLTKFICIILLVGFYLPEVKSKQDTSPSCYSSYHLEQKIKLSIKLENSSERKHVNVDTEIHIRKVNTPKKLLAMASTSKAKRMDIESFVMLVIPKFSKVNGVEANYGERYSHPLLFHIDQNSGELVDYQSTQSDKMIINEYLSYIDFFQYSQLAGSYTYRNGNGQYTAQISPITTDEGAEAIVKRNVGYAVSNNKLTLINNKMNILLSDDQDNCFYHSAEIEESFRNNISKNAFVDGSAFAKISSDYSISLSKDHYFYSLTSELSTWPSVEKIAAISAEKALAQLPVFFEELQSIIDNKSEFLIAMKSNKALWHYFAEYLSSNESDVRLVNKVIWALDRIDSTLSVTALLKIAITPSSKKYVNQAIQALASTSASIDIASLDLLKEQIESYRFSTSNTPSSLLLVRALGLFAKHRDNNSPLQSSEIKQFLYSQMEGSSEEFKVTLIESIGSLGETIDSQGVMLLITALDDSSNDVSRSASMALIKIPYDTENTNYYISKLDSDISSPTKTHLIELLGNTQKTDQGVKNKLLTIVAETNNIYHKKSSLKSLQKIDYSFDANEIELLKSRLRKETDTASQRLLASLILKHQSKQRSSLIGAN